MKLKQLSIVVLALAVTACSSYSSAQLTAPGGASLKDPTTTQSESNFPKRPSEIFLTSGDITDRTYDVVADIDVQVNKTTIFHPDPTPALVDEALKRRAAAIGADAVIKVSYGEVGISLISWGSLDGKGTAVKYKN